MRHWHNKSFQLRGTLLFHLFCFFFLFQALSRRIFLIRVQRRTEDKTSTVALESAWRAAGRRSRRRRRGSDKRMWRFRSASKT